MSDNVSLTVGHYNVGSVSIDGERVKGEGGPEDPRLVVPLTVTINPRPTSEQIAVIELHCSLHLVIPSAGAHDRNQFGPTVSVRPEPFAVSVPHGPHSRQMEARFPLSPPLIAQLEAYRHRNEAKSLIATVRVQPSISWVYLVGNSFSAPNEPESNSLAHPFGPQMGILSVLARFWTVDACHAPLRVSVATWIDQVLPGFGIDRLRLIEIALPPSDGPLPSGVITDYDAARREYDAGRYRECIEKCRYVRNAVEKHFGATEKNNPVAEVIANRLGLGAAAPQRVFLKKAWAAFADLTNAGHHLASDERLSPADAQACLLLAATLLEYLANLLKPPPIGLAGP